jgi:hypothetical protein
MTGLLKCNEQPISIRTRNASDLIWRKPAGARETNIGEPRLSLSEDPMKILPTVDGCDEMGAAHVERAPT